MHLLPPTVPCHAATGTGDPTTGHRLEAVLFDMDGTLVDSEKVWSVGLDELAGHYGAELSDEARMAMVGTNMAESMQILHTDIGQPWRDAAASVRWLEDRVKELFAEGLVWRPGARELLTALHAESVPMALVTATSRHLVDVALATIGTHFFDAVVAGDDVVETKPHPMPYLTAAGMVGARPDRCVAVEDSPNGLISAAAAGCVVLGVPCEVPLHTGGEPRVSLIGSLTEVDPPALRRLVARHA